MYFAYSIYFSVLRVILHKRALFTYQISRKCIKICCLFITLFYYTVRDVTLKYNYY